MPMAQRILESGQIQALAQRDIPRLIAPPETLFAARGARLRALAEGNAIAGYLRLMARVCDAQQELLDGIDAATRARLREDAWAQRPAAATEAGMPPLPGNCLKRDPIWRDWLRELLRRCCGQAGVPPQVDALLQDLQQADDAALEARADALLAAAGGAGVDAAAAPFVMAALQLLWTVLAGDPRARALQPMADAPGLCPACGTPPVASIVHAQAPHANYRYLACGLCNTQWHYVRIQCSRCGQPGKDIAQQALAYADALANPSRDAAVRAETCEACHGYRKIVYAEKDPAVEPHADDLGTLALDLLLGEAGYERASQHPLLWQAAGD